MNENQETIKDVIEIKKTNKEYFFLKGCFGHLIIKRENIFELEHKISFIRSLQGHPYDEDTMVFDKCEDADYLQAVEDALGEIIDNDGFEDYVASKENARSQFLRTDDFRRNFHSHFGEYSELFYDVCFASQNPVSKFVDKITADLESSVKKLDEFKAMLDYFYTPFTVVARIKFMSGGMLIEGYDISETDFTTLVNYSPEISSRLKRLGIELNAMITLITEGEESIKEAIKELREKNQKEICLHVFKLSPKETQLQIKRNIMAKNLKTKESQQNCFYELMDPIVHAFFNRVGFTVKFWRWVKDNITLRKFQMGFDIRYILDKIEENAFHGTLLKDIVFSGPIKSKVLA